ncbi:hypothetical protein [Neobacillus bataviensis]|uniref:hypothetical protein n=1 Tax=Neobacillus bataviensis TaxID=220685 RepID=UPI001CBAA165|nr:hypothetical protein [Neobacillus bataviensis]
MWWKSKFILLSCSLTLMFLSICSLGKSVYAEKLDTEGFIIEADRVVGSGMTASIVKQETTENDQKPMLRFQYQSATIYGMRLTKMVDSANGPVSITLKASGPVTVKGMTVDTTAISFKGACINASETVPELGMEDVVMVAHYMKAEDSLIEKLVLNTISGNAGAEKPGKLQVLQDLSLLPLDQLDKKIEKISAGHLPLTCADGSKTDAPSGGIGKITDPIQDVIDVVTNPLEPVTKPLEPILKPLDPITKPLEPVLKPLEPVVKPLEPVLKPLEPVISGTTEKVEQVVKSVCEQMEDAKGVINKELALALIDEAIAKKLPLNKVCQTNTSLTKELQSWEESLLKSLGLIDLLGKVIVQDPIQQLNKMRDKISKTKDGAIIFTP